MTGPVQAPRRVVIVGASLAGLRTAQALRSEGFAGSITLVGAEPHLPYDRPPLSKQVLRGDWDAARATLVDPAGLAVLNTDVHFGRTAVALDPQRRRVELDDGEALAYDALVLATGARARPAPWRVPSGLYTLRTLDDSLALAPLLAAAFPLVVIGAGFIGTEVAAAARARGCPVTLVDSIPLPMERLAGADLGAVLAVLPARYGVDTRFGVGVASIDGAEGDLSVRLDDGSRISAGAVVVGIGSRPNTEWLASSGLTIADGVMCDEQLRAVGHDDVFAVGDVASCPDPVMGRHVRSEHWTSAIEQAQFVAMQICRSGGDARFVPSGYVWSDQFDWKVQLVGRRPSDGRSHRLGDADGGATKLAVVHEDERGTVTGAITVNWPRALLQCRLHIDARLPAADLMTELTALPIRSSSDQASTFEGPTN